MQKVAAASLLSLLLMIPSCPNAYSKGWTNIGGTYFRNPLHHEVASKCSLTRPEALKFLKENGLPPFSSRLPIGRNVTLELFLTALKPVKPNLAREIDAGYRAMVELGYITINQRGLSYDIRPTELGLTKGRVVKGDYFGYSESFVFTITDQIASNITGIRTLDDFRCSVEFSYVLDEQNQVFRIMLPNGKQGDFGGQAEFELYDDGWRIVSIKTDLD